MPNPCWAYCAHCERWFYPTAAAGRRFLSCPVCLVPPTELTVEEPTATGREPIGAPDELAREAS